ncbi:phage terminase large subunit family protein [Thiotrichales bacterium 19S3-7]|nr:phage terminase large subunit family protein [Thiotrichales bacterium 19S3-7]MCF6802793.1 phage terminase large subunit family protein [Thiotrichales bacterium 19S3-11]
MTHLIKKTIERACEYLKPPKDLTISEWAEKYRYIPAGNSSIPGKWRTLPYQREVLNIATDPRVEKVTLMWGAQLGKTEMISSIIGYHIHHDPCSQMMMQPTQGDLKTWLETKFNPMIDYTPELQATIAKPRGRDGVNNQQMKSYFGGFLIFAWSGSASTLRGRSAPKIFCDEVSSYEFTSEGHPVNLIWQRAATFGSQRKLFLTSTPTIKDSCFIEQSFLEGDQRYYHVPCVHCNELQTLEWEQISWEETEEGKLKIDSVTYTCPHCACIISDADKIAMVRKGQWIAAKSFYDHASFHLSELYSPFRKFSDIVKSYLEKKKSGDLQSFLNVSLAKTWDDEAERIESGHLIERVEDYHFVPLKCGLLTAGIDIQQDRIEMQVIAWADQEEAFVLDYRVLNGSPAETQVWHDLSDALKRHYKHESGFMMSIEFAGLDTGGTENMTAIAYEYISKRPIGRPFALKGRGGDYPFTSAPNRKKTGKNKRKVTLYTVGTNEGKNILFSRLRIENHGAGFIHFRKAVCDYEYFEQLTAEKRKINKGKKGYQWVNTRYNNRNEALDTYLYAYAALKISNVDVKIRQRRIIENKKNNMKKEYQKFNI